MEKYSRIKAQIDLDAIAFNFEQMKRNLSEGTKMVAVIKADGYGHGSRQIAHLVQDYDYIWGFATATVEEAVELRHGGVTKPILLLGYAFPEHYGIIAEYDLSPAVFKLDMAEQLSKAAQVAGKEITIHLAVDTGMTRIGVADCKDSIPAIEKIGGLPGIKITGAFTHFARADEESKEPAYVQMERFTAFLSLLEQHHIHIPLRHCSNSAGLIRMQEANMDMVRAGISIYGMYPSDEVETNMVTLRPAMSLISHISYIKEVAPGVSISYGGTYTTKRKTTVATIPVGYADGYPRQLSNKGSVLIKGQRAPILGRVCMDQFMVDITDLTDVHELDAVTLLGQDGEESITAEELGSLSGRFHYELVCNISKRVPRVYVQNGSIVEEQDYFS
ncbi:MAG: alanine racemase [Lachnospiraceae bacterium]|nr:alanine racemase [Lachnospiraceae bacterium]